MSINTVTAPAEDPNRQSSVAQVAEQYFRNDTELATKSMDSELAGMASFEDMSQAITNREDLTTIRTLENEANTHFIAQSEANAERNINLDHAGRHYERHQTEYQQMALQEATDAGKTITASIVTK
jgi:hypothetical protein